MKFKEIEKIEEFLYNSNIDRKLSISCINILEGSWILHKIRTGIIDSIVSQQIEKFVAQIDTVVEDNSIKYIVSVLKRYIREKTKGAARLKKIIIHQNILNKYLDKYNQARITFEKVEIIGQDLNDPQLVIGICDSKFDLLDKNLLIYKARLINDN